MTVGNIASSAGFSPQIQIGNNAPQAEESSFFWDILDVINPLQHIPLVSNLYRNLTGDSLSPIANIAGGALFGGPLGAAGAATSEIIKAGLSGESTQTALANSTKAEQAYGERIRVTTADWLNPDFGRSLTA